ncbi:carboxypeptidase-like regulatory domain-containing protein [Gilvibacter sp. SZ-19]|uniref:carboxypeptidase-like regulatory domain-containing protein n=1 Tax=unclassified Gilvibacter TaxID=2625242 RepID=UPI000B3BFE9D|nr:carboxypeptidase-like regulatory domain-containing protein [Gilvibacter sp. SZ-19]
MLKKLVLAIVAVLFVLDTWAQNTSKPMEVTINAYVLDGSTNTPIAFANIGFVEKGVGTVSDENGKFRLNFDEAEIGLNGVLQISTLGYQTKTFKLVDLYGLLEKNNIIYLNPTTYSLDEVVLTNDKRKTIEIGNIMRTRATLGYWKDKEGLGGEIATRVRIKKDNTRLDTLKFDVVENQADSLKIRVNIYDYQKRYPAKNLLSQNIFYTLKSDIGAVAIPLTDYNIYVSEDIVVSIELVEVYGDKIEFAIAASAERGVAYTRSISQDKWERYSDTGMGFYLIASVPTGSGNKSEAREDPERITIYWDASLSQLSRSFDEEFDLLESYLKAVKAKEVRVIRFGAGWQENQDFNCEDCSEILAYLKSSTYFGGSGFEQVLQDNNFNAETILFFSDGESVFGPPLSPLNIPIFSINSQAEANHTALQDLSLYADGHYIDLSRINPKEGLGLMLNEVDDKVVYAQRSEELSLKGQVTASSGPIQGAKVWVKDTYNQVLTDTEGNYKINANSGDVLVVSFLGMLDKEVVVPEGGSLNVFLETDGELLDEVVIEAEKNQDDIKTPYGKKSRKALGFAADFILAEDIPPYYTNLSQLLAGLSGVQVIGFGDDAEFIFTRSIASSISNSSLPVIVVDGIIYTQDQRPFIDVQNIDNVAIFRGLAATNRYGSIAAYGAIRIETKTFALTGAPPETKPSALVTGNDYQEVLLPSLDSGAVIPEYLKSLYTASSFEQAKEIHQSQRKRYKQDISYFVDVSEYFLKWDAGYAKAILSSLAEVAPNNIQALRIMAYAMESYGFAHQTIGLHRQIIALEPTQVQGYRDLALALQQDGQYQEAFEVYKRLLSGTIDGLVLGATQGLLEHELQHLVAQHKDRISYKDLPTSLLKADFDLDLRLVFQWTDPNASFELQFVNPEKKYYQWSHTPFLAKERMLEEAQAGFTMEEFILDDNRSGKWLINVEHLGESDLLYPSYMKYTVYTDYGTDQQQIRTKLIKLYQQTSKVTLDSFYY